MEIYVDEFSISIIAYLEYSKEREMILQSISIIKMRI